MFARYGGGDDQRHNYQGEFLNMKKLMLLALGLGLALGTVSFAQDTTAPKTDTTKPAKKTKTKKAKKTTTPPPAAAPKM
jgi:hypothetical protein